MSYVRKYAIDRGYEIVKEYIEPAKSGTDWNRPQFQAISDGVTIDDNGDAVATKKGTYQVRAKIKDGSRWEIVDPETGEITYTTEDQIITFNITGKEDPKKQYTIIYELEGGQLDGDSGPIKNVYDEGTVITLTEPTREGYTFEYWEGSRYDAGEKYTVNEDHTFIAHWKKNKDDPYDPDDPDKPVDPDKPKNPDKPDDPGSKAVDTGDENNMLLWLAILLISTAGLATAAGRKNPKKNS